VLLVTLRWRLDAPENLVKLAVGRCLIAEMDYGRWTELGLLTDTSDQIQSHGRLLRSLRFGDDDYDGCVLDMVPTVLGEVPQPSRDPWDPLAPDPAPLTLHERFPRLEVVSDYLDLPAWLALNDEKLFTRLLSSDEADRTLPDGTVLSAAESAAARLEVGEMRRQVERIRRDHADDPEAAVGQSKELIETTCKTILGLTGDAAETKEDLPKLIARTLSHLGLDPAQIGPVGGDPLEARAAKRMLGGVSSVLNGAGELRNARGTGHGRSGSPLVDAALARMTVGLVLPAIVYLIEVYEARTGGGPGPVLVDHAPPAQPLRPGVIVSHDTFGEGQIVAVEGSGDQRVATVDFGTEAGTKRLLVRYAPLQVVRP
jgi:hypothetical protein